MRIVYVSFRGQFSDSPRALYEELLRRDVDATHTWLSAPHARADFPPGVATAAFGSPESIRALESADLVIANDGISLDWRKGAHTTYLQTWHGTMLKRIHRDAVRAPGPRTRLDDDVARWDLLLSPNAVTTARLRSGFGYRGPVRETGLPRNDLLSSPRRDEVRAAVRARLGIAEDRTVVLYTPTWRDDLVLDGIGPRDFDFPIDVHDFTERLGDDHVLLLRLHHMVSDRLEILDRSRVRDVSGARDVGELYLAADVLVTDYSSTMFDFAITGKPILLLTYDLEYYRDELRGFYDDPAAIAPTPLLRTSKELVGAIADIDTIARENAARYAAFRETYCQLEDGAATTRVLDLLFPSTDTTTPRGS